MILRLKISMADPLSITVSVLAVVTAALQSTQSLYQTVQRYRKRDKTLGRLQDELGDVVKLLSSVKEVVNDEQSMFTHLRGPIERCDKVCSNFEQSMNKFKGKSKTGILDWAKMEFMKGDVNEFIDTLWSYKSTISVHLGAITLLVAIILVSSGLH